MSRFGLTPAALDDLEDIFLYTASEFGNEQAIKWENSLFETFDLLADFPSMGRQRPDLTRRPFLFFLSDPYLIAYEPETRPLIIHGVLHGSRDIRKLLKNRRF